MRDCSYNVQSIYHLQQISIIIVVILLTGSIARSATCRYLIYSEADFEVFRPQGRHVAPIGVKFGTEEGTPPPPCQISPQVVQRLGYRGPQTEIFTEIWSKCEIETCSRSCITMPSLMGLGFHPSPGGQKR